LFRNFFNFSKGIGASGLVMHIKKEIGRWIGMLMEA
jgi:hypothetical protein